MWHRCSRCCSRCFCYPPRCRHGNAVSWIWLGSVHSQFMTWWRILAQANPVACCSFTPSLAVIFCQLPAEKAKNCMEALGCLLSSNTRPQEVKSVPTSHGKCRLQCPWEVYHHHVWQELQDWTCSLGNKGRIMLFHRPAQLSYSMSKGLPTKQAAYGTKQQRAKYKLKAQQTRDGRKMVRSGKSFGRPFHPLTKVVSS